MSKFNCRIGRRYHRGRPIKLSSSLHQYKRSLFDVALAIVFTVWVGRAVWHEAGLAELLEIVHAQPAGRTQGKDTTLGFVGAKGCRVTIRGANGIEHSTQVTAESLFEAVARGMAALQQDSWSEDLSISSVTVTTCDTPVEHTVKLKTFEEWLAHTGGSPEDVATRLKAKEILGRKAR